MPTLDHSSRVQAITRRWIPASSPPSNRSPARMWATDQTPTGSQDFTGRDSVTAKGTREGQVEGSGIGTAGAEHGGMRGRIRGRVVEEQRAGSDPAQLTVELICLTAVSSSRRC